MTDKHPTVSRTKLFAMEDNQPLREALMQANAVRMQNGADYNPFLPIRLLPFSAYFDKADRKAMENDSINPDLPRIMHEQW